MIFRAVFWIGLVSLLTPHEPDLGLGRPGAGTSQLSPATLLSAASGLSRTDKDCGAACAGGLGFGDIFHLNANARFTAGLAESRHEAAEVVRCLREGRDVVDVPSGIADRARRSVEAMIAIGTPGAGE